jgi:hypothetical protein
MKTLLHLMLISATLVSCKKFDSSEVDQTKIKQVYEVQYFSDNDITEITASFHYANGWGNSIVLSGNANITFNNTPLKYNNITRNYKLYLSGQHLLSSFKFTDNNGNAYVNNGTYVTPVQYNSYNGLYINRQSDFTIGMGTIPGSSNTINLNFANKIFYANRFGSSYMFNILQSDLNDINPGYYNATFSNNVKTYLQQNTGGDGSITTTYFSNSFNIQVF